MSVGGGGSTPEPAEQEQALAERGAMEFNDFVERGVPAARKLADLVSDPGHAARQAGQANAAAAEAYATEAKDGLDAALASGDRVGSGTAVSRMALTPLKATSAAGVGIGKARQAVKNRELAGNIKLAAFGRGVSEDSSLNLRSAGENATRQSIAEANARTERFVSGLDALGKAAGYAGGQALNKVSYGQEMAAFKAANPKATVPRPSGLAGWAFDRARR